MTALHAPSPASAASVHDDLAHSHSPHTLRRAGRWAGALVLVLLAGAALRGWSNTRQADTLARDSASDAVRAVLTVSPKPAPRSRNLTLPGTLRGRQEAIVYARTSGYLQRWTKDIGDTVRAGELLAVLDAPEAEDELRQARAALDQVRARATLAQSSLARFETLGERDAISRQELDERRATRNQASADQAAAEANVKRLESLAALRRITAPFDGVVLRRQAEVGMLITTANARELYTLAEIDRLRIELAVPQTYANDVQPGQTVQVRWPERPGAPVTGRIARTAPGIDTATRTRQVVIELDNPGRKLLPGSYVDVQWKAGGDGDNKGKKQGGKQGDKPVAKPEGSSDEPGVLMVPAGVLQFRQDGPRVAVVSNGRVALRSVQLGRDLGRTVEVLSGLRPKDQLVLNPPDALTDGEAVSARAAEEAKPS